jgi:hypothetical protein
MAGIGFGALVAAALSVVPAIGAPSDDAGMAAKRPVTLSARGGIGSFTPAAADPRLAASLSRVGLGATGFRFTPTETRRGGSRAVTVAVRARSASAPAQTAAVEAPNVGIAPIAYSLGAAVGWRRFALSGDMTKIDLAGMPGSREAVDVGVSYTGRRASARVLAAADRPIGTTPQLIERPAYSVDLGGSYSLTRNIDLTAGVRYKSDRERLQRLQEDRRDSQAVYVGTAFRF